MADAAAFAPSVAPKAIRAQGAPSFTSAKSAAVSVAEETPEGFRVRLAGGGRFAAWCAARPAAVRVGKKDVPFSWDPATRLLLADVPAASGRTPDVLVADSPRRGPRN